MALKKVKELPSGATGEYWKIISVVADRSKLELTCRIALFKNKEASDAGKPHLGLVHSFTKPITKTESEDNLVEKSYVYIKQQIQGQSPSNLSPKKLAYNDLQGAVDA